MDKVLLKYTEYNDTVVSQTNKDILEVREWVETKSAFANNENCYWLTRPILLSYYFLFLLQISYFIYYRLN